MVYLVHVSRCLYEYTTFFYIVKVDCPNNRTVRTYNRQTMKEVQER